MDRFKTLILLQFIPLWCYARAWGQSSRHGGYRCTAIYLHDTLRRHWASTTTGCYLLAYLRVRNLAEAGSLERCQQPDARPFLVSIAFCPEACFGRFNPSLVNLSIYIYLFVKDIIYVSIVQDRFYPPQMLKIQACHVSRYLHVHRVHRNHINIGTKIDDLNINKI